MTFFLISRILSKCLIFSLAIPKIGKAEVGKNMQGQINLLICVSVHLSIVGLRISGSSISSCEFKC